MLRTPIVEGVALATLTALLSVGCGGAASPEPATAPAAAASPMPEAPAKAAPEPAPSAAATGAHADPTTALVRLKSGKADLGGGAQIAIPGRIEAAHPWKPGDPRIEIASGPPVAVTFNVLIRELVPVRRADRPAAPRAEGQGGGRDCGGNRARDRRRIEGRVRARFVGKCVPKFDFWVDEWAVGPMALERTRLKPSPGKPQLVKEDTVLYSAPGAKLFNHPPAPRRDGAPHLQHARR